MNQIKPTLADVAQQAGVATSTASRILNGYTKGFSAAGPVRERVLAAAEALGYKANPLLRGLKAKRTMLVQILNLSLPTFHISDDHVQGVNNVVQKLQAVGYNVCGRFDLFNIKQETHRELVPDIRVDGCVIIGVADRSRMKALEATGLPYVSLNGNAGPHGISIQTNDTLGMHLAMQHLHQRGHRRIFYVTVNLGVVPYQYAVHDSVLAREHAYHAYANVHKLPILPGYNDHGLTVADIIALIRAQGATAVITYDHIHALKIHQALLAEPDLGYPERLSLICFNDQTPVEYTTPALTAIHVPFQNMGTIAAEVLIDAMNPELARNKCGTTITLDPWLVERASSAARLPTDV